MTNAIVGAATTEIAGHRRGDLCWGRMGILHQESSSLHDLTSLTVAALGNVGGDPGLLQRVENFRAETFNGCNLSPGYGGDGSSARARRVAVDMNGASTTQSGATAILRSSKFERVAQNP